MKWLGVLLSYSHVRLGEAMHCDCVSVIFVGTYVLLLQCRGCLYASGRTPSFHIGNKMISNGNLSASLMAPTLTDFDEVQDSKSLLTRFIGSVRIVRAQRTSEYSSSTIHALEKQKTMRRVPLWLPVAKPVQSPPPSHRKTLLNS